MSEISQRLFLIMPPDPELLTTLGPVLDDPVIACALIRPEPPPETLPDAAFLAAIVSALQRHEIAVLFDDQELAAHTSADGVYLAAGADDFMTSLQQAIKSLKPDGIVGAGGFNNRHDAMLAGEQDIDFIMFGDPSTHQRSLPPGDVADHAGWWAEIFTIPCVALATDASAIAPIKASGCEFIALHLDGSRSGNANLDLIATALTILKADQA